MAKHARKSKRATKKTAPRPAAKSKKPPKRTAPKTKARAKAKSKSASAASTPPTAPKIPAKSALIATLPAVSRVQFTGNGQALLLARFAQKTLALYDLASASETPPLKALPNFSAAALSPDNRFIALGTSSGILAVESTQTGKTLWKTPATRDAVHQLLFSLDGTLLIAAANPDIAPGSANGWLRVHKLPTGEPDASLDPVENALCSHLALSPDGLFLAHSEMRSNSVLVWHLPSRQMASCLRLNPLRGPIVQLAFGLSIRHLIIAQQSHVSAWNGESGQEYLSFSPFPAGEQSVIHSLAVINHAATLATTRIISEENRAFLDLWNAESGRLRRAIPLPTAALEPLAAAPDGKLLALPTTKNDCWLWNAEKLAT